MLRKIAFGSSMAIRTLARFLALASGFVGACGIAQAEDCSLKMLSKIKLITAEGGHAELVPVVIAGSPRKLLLDTGAPGSEITNRAAVELKLSRLESEVKTYSLAGDTSDRSADASLQLGRIKFEHVRFQVAPPSHEETNFDGLLGVDVLRNFDSDLDFGAHELNIFSQDHCDGKVVYWGASTLAIVPYELVWPGHIVIPVELDGKPLKAEVDTGASKTTLRLKAARRYFGIDPKPADATGTLFGDKNLLTYQHVFKAMTLEGINIYNPDITLIPDVVSKQIDSPPTTGSHIQRADPQSEPDMLVGMNVLRHLHVYIAFKEKKLYITPAVPPETKNAY